MSTTPETNSVKEDAAANEGERRYESLDDAFRDKKTTLTNQAFIRGLLASIEIESFDGRSGYIKAVRADGHPAIQIYPGYTNGFQTEAEILQGAGDVDRWKSDRLQDTWGVSHPDNDMHGGNLDRHTKKEAQACPECGNTMPLSGTCDWC